MIDKIKEPHSIIEKEGFFTYDNSCKIFINRSGNRDSSI